MSFKWPVLFALISILAGLGAWQSPHRTTDTLCRHDLRSNADSLFEGSNSLFASAGKCDHCHGPDPAGVASVDYQGNDINLVNDWQSSMMALSARDPFWRAKVSHEVHLFPDAQNEIESTCTRCHAPLGHFAAMTQGAGSYTIAEMIADEVALDGVSCLACHQRDSLNLENHFSGELFFTLDSKAFGQYESPLVTPMALYSGYVPEHSTHVRKAALCGGCHTLITETLDELGNGSGNMFIEQATYHEWLNSQYAADGVTCQGCHMPVMNKQLVHLAAGFNTPPRELFARHELVGANTLMLKLMKQNRESLGISATDDMFDQTLNLTFEQLQQKSIVLELTEAGRTADSAFFELKVTNTAGHKLPSGYPARKVSLQFSVEDEEGFLLWQSGGFDTDYYINGEDQPFEPHHQQITAEAQVQVYEMVMSDANGQVTTVLNRAHHVLKDNRLVPAGFSVQHPAYDTTQVVGVFGTDTDFNSDGQQGSGTDVVHYRIALNGYTGPLTVRAKAWYQSLPPRWMEELFSASTPEIDSFHAMFDEADRSPVLMHEAELLTGAYTSVAGESTISAPWFSMTTTMLHYSVAVPGSAQLFDSRGRLIERFTFAGTLSSVPVKVVPGLYLMLWKPYDGVETLYKLPVSAAR